MISMYAEYSGRTLYVALSSDTIDGAKNGDKLYEMDTGKRYVYNESNDAWDEQPEEGGGGGGYEYQRLEIVNKRNTSTQFAYIIQDDNIPGVGAINIQNLNKDGVVGVPHMLIQNGRFTVGCYPAAVVPTSVKFGGETLDCIIVDRKLSVPYVGVGRYEFYF